MEIRIRPARPADADELYRMLCDLENTVLARESFNVAFLNNLGNENIRYLIAEVHGSPVGMASCHVQWLLHHAAPVAEIQEMYVDPALRSQGIGQQLVEAIRQFARLRGATQLEVTSNLIRLKTHRFYEREGFQKTHAKLVVKF
jgi:PhnO protein